MFQLDLQRQQLIQERQQFHAEQIKAAELRARLQAQQLFTQQHGPLPSGLLPSGSAAAPATAIPVQVSAPLLQQSLIGQHFPSVVSVSGPMMSAMHHAGAGQDVHSAMTSPPVVTHMAAMDPNRPLAPQQLIPPMGAKDGMQMPMMQTSYPSMQPTVSVQSMVRPAMQSQQQVRKHFFTQLIDHVRKS